MIRSGIAASVIGHLSVLTLVLIFAEVHPFGSVTAEPITVDLVSPDEATRTPRKEEPPCYWKTHHIAGRLRRVMVLSRMNSFSARSADGLFR